MIPVLRHKPTALAVSAAVLHAARVSAVGGWRSMRPSGVRSIQAIDGQSTTTAAQVRAALIVITVFALVTAAIAPFARQPGVALPGFVPAYQATVFLLYAMTFLHLVAHVRRSGSRALLHIAAGCLYSALILLAQMFSFPIWGAVQIVGSTSATTSWLWCFWHLGPTIFTFTYVTVRPTDVAGLIATRPATTRATLIAVLASILVVGAAVAAATWAVSWLPTIVRGDDYSMLTTSGVGPAVLIATIATLGLLIFRTRCASSVELVLAVALALLAMDDILTLIGASRLSIGWYAGRAEAAISAGMLLAFYMVELNRRFVTVADQAASLVSKHAAMAQAVETQIEANATLALLARQDGLTQLANRRCFDEALWLEWRRARRNHEPVTLLMIDVDYFKLYNDRYGHQPGDTCLRTVAALINDVTNRAGDLAARYGGEEFVILTMTDERGGKAIAEALRTAVRACAIPHVSSPSGLLTLSIGIATLTPASDDDGCDALVAAADRALYCAKAQGRDRAVSVAEMEGSVVAA